MKFAHAAISAVQRNLMALLIYAGGILVIQAFGIVFDFWLTGGGPINPETVSPRVKMWALIVTLLQAPLSAAVTAVAFARIGKEMDHPLWRSSNDRDALRRFFQVWLILILTGTALAYMAGLAGSRESALAIPIFLLYLLLTVLTIPIGACIMFSGALQWKELGQALAPLGYQLPRTLLLVVVMTLQQLMVEQVLKMRVTPGAGYNWLMLAPVVTVIGAYLDCLVFAGAWLMCIDHRNVDQNIDFDF